MKISVITVCYNSAQTIRDTLESVRKQDYSNYEHIIIDGKSKDQTLSIVAEYARPQLTVVSEKDKGIYDAMNKGLVLATGDVIGFLNSDDFYANKKVLSRLAEAFQKTGSSIVFGDIHYVKKDEADKVSRVWKSGAYDASRIQWGWHPPHPGFYVTRGVVNKIGNFNLNYPIAADYDFMIRCLLDSTFTVHHLPYSLVMMRDGGTSNQSVRNILKANRECYQALRIQGKRFVWISVCVKILRKLFQFPLIYKITIGRNI